MRERLTAVTLLYRAASISTRSDRDLARLCVLVDIRTYFVSALVLPGNCRRGPLCNLTRRRLYVRTRRVSA